MISAIIVSQSRLTNWATLWLALGVSQSKACKPCTRGLHPGKGCQFTCQSKSDITNGKGCEPIDIHDVINPIARVTLCCWLWFTKSMSGIETFKTCLTVRFNGSRTMKTNGTKTFHLWVTWNNEGSIKKWDTQAKELDPCIHWINLESFQTKDLT
jgi:hypothetical protein